MRRTVLISYKTSRENKHAEIRVKNDQLIDKPRQHQMPILKKEEIKCVVA